MAKICYKTVSRKLKRNSIVSWLFCAKMLNILHMVLISCCCCYVFFFVMRYETMSMVISIHCYFFWNELQCCDVSHKFLLFSFSFFNLCSFCFSTAVAPSMCSVRLWTNVLYSDFSRQFYFIVLLLLIDRSFVFIYISFPRHFRRKKC